MMTNAKENVNTKNLTKMRTIKKGKLTFYFGIEQGTQEWLDLRSQLVTCSNSLALCDKGRTHAVEINRQHATRKTPNENEYAIRGHLLEGEIRGRLEEAFNNDEQEIISCSFITHEDFPGAGYSPDGILIDAKTKEFIAPIEIKCFNDVTRHWNKKLKKFDYEVKNKHKLCCEDVHNIPLENRMQFEMEMLLTATDHVIVVLYNPDADTKHGVPILKIHEYTPEKFHDEDGKEYYAYRERVKERLLER